MRTYNEATPLNCTKTQARSEADCDLLCAALHLVGWSFRRIGEAFEIHHHTAKTKAEQTLKVRGANAVKLGDELQAILRDYGDNPEAIAWLRKNGGSLN